MSSCLPPRFPRRLVSLGDYVLNAHSAVLDVYNQGTLDLRSYDSAMFKLSRGVRGLQGIAGVRTVWTSPEQAGESWMRPRPKATRKCSSWCTNDAGSKLWTRWTCSATAPPHSSFFLGVWAFQEVRKCLDGWTSNPEQAGERLLNNARISRNCGSCIALKTPSTMTSHRHRPAGFDFDQSDFHQF